MGNILCAADSVLGTPWRTDMAGLGTRGTHKTCGNEATKMPILCSSYCAVGSIEMVDFMPSSREHLPNKDGRKVHSGASLGSFNFID